MWFVHLFEPEFHFMPWSLRKCSGLTFFPPKLLLPVNFVLFPRNLQYMLRKHWVTWSILAQGKASLLHCSLGQLYWGTFQVNCPFIRLWVRTRMEILVVLHWPSKQLLSFHFIYIKCKQFKNYIAWIMNSGARGLREDPLVEITSNMSRCHFRRGWTRRAWRHQCPGHVIPIRACSLGGSCFGKTKESCCIKVLSLIYLSLFKYERCEFLVLKRQVFICMTVSSDMWVLDSPIAGW